jgi:hypothetical protein
VSNLEDNSDEYHYVEIKNNKTDVGYSVVYNSYETLCNSMDILFESGGDFDVFYELDEEKLTIEQFLNIMNKNPKCGKLENPENCQTIEEYKDWLDDFLDILDVEDFLSS